MSISQIIQQHPKKYAFWTGCPFLIGYWFFGFDGITFSDDVYYLLAGKSFWEGTMEVNSYHFSSRWGAYVPSGLIGFVLGFEAHRISLISLLSYLGTMALLLKLLPSKANPWILITWFCTQVYFLHFLTKVYPDSQLVFWTALVPFSAYYRNSKPFLAALGVISGLFFGFLTKETIVFLAPLPLFLLIWDWKKGEFSKGFFWSLLGLGALFASGYLGYFWWEFGNPLYRLESIQDGHYVSEYTYADKSLWIMLKRLTILPIQTFVERAYWLWLVLAIPGLLSSLKNRSKGGMEICLALICLLLGFWLMSTNFRFYNPLYLNPRHLIILVPLCAYLIALGWKELWENSGYRTWILALLALGVMISGVQQDWKMVLFQVAFLGLFWGVPGKFRIASFAILLLVPAIQSIFYQQKLKAYPSFLEALQKETKDTSSPILVNNFVHFSREVLLPENKNGQALLLPIEKLDSLKPLLPSQFRVLIYDYYQHAYPKEAVDVEHLEEFLEQDCQVLEEKTQGKVQLRYIQKD